MAFFVKRTMVHINTLKRMQNLFDRNIEQYVRDHPGEYVFMEEKGPKVSVTFYSKQPELERELVKYKKRPDGTAPTCLLEKLPETILPHTKKYRNPAKTIAYFAGKN